MNFYATLDGTGQRTVCAFPTKRLRDWMAAHAPVTACPASHARFVRERDLRHDSNLPYNFLDMRVGEYWDGELTDLWDRTHELGLW